MEFYYDHMCFACGEKNPKGLHLKFSIEDNKVKTLFIPEKEHEGYPGVMHGGLITTILDEVMARSINILGYHGVTARLEVRFREPVPIGNKISFESTIINARKKLVDLEAKAYLPNGKVAVEASARFMIIGEIEQGKKIHEE
ncbi:MAG: PaaI family thioesterase [Peptococcales bacterium]|jgi:acyl-coenzyme A thioesterase PaaI-like protein